tara:strand:+ start:255 stop:830 length:576 start_codon:yes stop_codon:yes gene_type:complete
MEYKIAILISGNGSNMLNILDACKKGEIKSKVVTVVSNNPDSSGITKAKDFGVNCRVINSDTLKNKNDFENYLSLHLKKFNVNLICLAGFMKILGRKFVKKWNKKIINIHPSLLPAFKGLNTHKRAINMKVKYAGCTIHYVNNKLDSGEILDQEIVKVLDTDNENSLKKKILMKEHKLYIKVLKNLERNNG